MVGTPQGVVGEVVGEVGVVAGVVRAVEERRQVEVGARQLVPPRLPRAALIQDQVAALLQVPALVQALAVAALVVGPVAAVGVGGETAVAVAGVGVEAP